MKVLDKAICLAFLSSFYMICAADAQIFCDPGKCPDIPSSNNDGGQNKLHYNLDIPGWDYKGTLNGEKVYEKIDYGFTGGSTPDPDPNDGGHGCFYVDYGDFIEQPNGDVIYCIKKECVGGV